MRSEAFAGADGVRWIPETPTGTGALVLAGSIGRIDSARAQLLAHHGVVAEALRWFGGEGQNKGPWDIPLETFLDRISDLARIAGRIVVVGTSFGAEAALLSGAHSSHVDAVAAFAPSDVVWAGFRDDGGATSHWTLGGAPLPYVRFVDDWEPDVDPPAFRGLYETSRRRAPDDVATASIPVERIAEVLVVAGGDDQVWPSLSMAQAIERRRAEHGLATTLLTDPRAGHRIVLPGEVVTSGGMRMQRGGDEACDRRLGTIAWAHLLSLLETDSRAL